MNRRIPAPHLTFDRLGRPSTVIPGFLAPDECRQVRIAMDQGVAEPAEILEGSMAVDAEARRAKLIDINPLMLATVEARLDASRDELASRCGVPLGDREGCGFIRYAEGGFYRPHRDRAIDTAWPAAAGRRLAVVVFLNDEFSGGELLIYPDVPSDEAPLRITPRQGLLVAFDAARLHEVRPVAGGVRDVIVDWFC
jgi:predicted 2-oxoglutarate/Fe(II)-dependent dioxygenase YbiX